MIDIWVRRNMYNFFIFLEDNKCCIGMTLDEAKQLVIDLQNTINKEESLAPNEKKYISELNITNYND